MKPDIHPNYTTAEVVCACGSVFETRATKPVLRIDLCSVCHPFYTGEQRIVDTAGQVERFMKRVEAASTTDQRPSKRQQRINERNEKLRAERQRQEEIAAKAAAEEEAARAAARAIAAEEDAARAAQAAATAEVAPAAAEVAEVADVEAETVEEIVEALKEDA